MVAERHQGEAKDIKKAIESIVAEPTSLDFYNDMEKRSFSSEVIFSEKNQISMKNTFFYPEGGGQLCDTGVINWDGKKSQVTNVQKVGDVVVHHLEGEIPPVGTKVSGVVDDDRRTGLSSHHTATHLIGAAARQILGPHVWQAGASKHVNRARLDITHHRRLTREVIDNLESTVNQMILDDHPVRTEFHSREDADRLYGNILYQGGAPKYREVRVVEISGVDIQACAGTHVTKTSKLEAVKVLRTERIQDGVERIESVSYTHLTLPTICSV